MTLAPSPRPVGQFLARRAGDSTFEHAPSNYHVFAAAGSGEHVNAEALILNFAGETTLTSIRMANNDFAVEPGGSCYEGNHYSAGQSCTLLVRFTPQGPGHRLGSVKITHSAETTATTLSLVGNAYTPAISFIPAIISTVPGTVAAGTGTITSSSSLAEDGGDVLYIADTGNNYIREINSSGTVNNVGAYGAAPVSIAVDSMGIVYAANVLDSFNYFTFYTPWLDIGTYFAAYSPGACTPNTPCDLSTVGLSGAAHMSIDGSDNLFFQERTKGVAEMPVGIVTGGNQTFNLWYVPDSYAYPNTSNPLSFGVDSVGNLFTVYHYINSCLMMVEPISSAYSAPVASRVVGTQCGFSGDGGKAGGAEISSTIGQIAFDAAGNLYFADTGNQRVRRIDASTGIIRTVAGNGTAGYSGDGSWATHATLANPTGVAVDSQGQVYILAGSAATGTAQVVRKVSNVGRQAFPSTALGKTAAAVQVVVNNTGNSDLVLNGTGWSGSTPGDFKVDPLTTSCSLNAGAVLTVGQSCNIGFVFAPTAVGSRAATFNLLSNTPAGQSQIVLSGSAVAAAAVKFTTPTANASLTANTSVSVQVGVTSSYATAPTGTVTFKVDGLQVGGPVPLVSGAASITLSGLTVGRHTLYATYNGDKHTAVAHVSETVVVN